MTDSPKPRPKVVRTVAGKPTGNSTGKAGFETREVKVRRHTRRTASGRQTTVRAHNRTMSTWKQAGVAWAGAGASGLVTLGLMLQFGFAILNVVFLLLTVVLGGVAGKLTAKASAPQRRMRAKATAKPRPRRRR